MKTWLRDDGVWVSKKPKLYIVGKDAIGNTILSEDMLIKFNKHNMTGIVTHGCYESTRINTRKFKETYTLYPHDEFVKFIENGYIVVATTIGVDGDIIQFSLPKIEQ